MQYKNHTDINLVNAADEAYAILSRLAEFLDVSGEKMHSVVRLRDAIYTAKAEMQMQEEADRLDFVSTTAPPTSMD